jgi:hypothetical protein
MPRTDSAADLPSPVPRSLKPQMSDGLYALIGVVVGVLGAGGREWFGAWVGDRRSARVAARLVFEELATNAGTVNRLLEQGAWPGEQLAPGMRIKRSAWDTHKATLARPRRGEPWARVAAAYVALDGVAEALERAPAGESLNSEARRGAENVRTVVAQALNAIGPLTGLPREPPASPR